MPTSPQGKIFAPINSKIDEAASISVFGPPNIKDKVPASKTIAVSYKKCFSAAKKINYLFKSEIPETGESMKIVLFSSHNSAIFLATAGSIVEQSRNSVPGEAVD